MKLLENLLNVVHQNWEHIRLVILLFIGIGVAVYSLSIIKKIK